MPDRFINYRHLIVLNFVFYSHLCFISIKNIMLLFKYALHCDMWPRLSNCDVDYLLVTVFGLPTMTMINDKIYFLAVTDHIVKWSSICMYILFVTYYFCTKGINLRACTHIIFISIMCVFPGMCLSHATIGCSCKWKQFQQLSCAFISTKGTVHPQLPILRPQTF